MDQKLILDYILATVNLYGIISMENLVMIINQQNSDPISIKDLDPFKKQEMHYVEFYKDHFVHEVILMDDDSFTNLLAHQNNKPFYIPEKKELLKYTDDFYYEVTKEFKALLDYIKRNLVKNKTKAEELTEDILLTCSTDFSADAVMEEFNRRNIAFDSKNQLNEVMGLVIQLANSCRIWENRGYTPNEMQAIGQASKVTKEVLIGRNDPCICGSGKKYKHCCMGKNQMH